MIWIIILGIIGLIGLILCSVGGMGILPWIGAIWLGYLAIKRTDFLATIFVLYMIGTTILGIFSVMN